jgi:Spy/CpxP family protein refolding chaperone
MRMDQTVDYYKRYRLALTVIVVLVVINLVTVGFVLLSPIGPGFLMGRERIQSTIEDELQLTDAQKRQYAALRARHFARGDSVFALQFRAMDSLFAMLGAGTVDSASVRHQAEILGSIETDRNIGLFQHFRDLRALCNADQQKKLDEVIGKVLVMIREPHGLPGPKPGPPPRP